MAGTMILACLMRRSGRLLHPPCDRTAGAMQFSPEGHWWWNSREWRPAAEAHRRRGPVGWLVGLSLLVVLVGIGICGPVVLLAGSHASSPTGYVTSVTSAVSN